MHSRPTARFLLLAGAIGGLAFACCAWLAGDRQPPVLVGSLQRVR